MQRFDLFAIILLRMNILELNFERTWRGGERQTIYNMLGFRNAGHEVALVCRKGYPLAQKAKEEGFKVHSFSNIFGVIFFLITKGRRYNVFHAQSSHILTYCLLTKSFHRCKIIFTRRVDFVPKGMLTKWKYKRTDKLVAISNAVRDIISKFSERDDVIVISDIVVPRKLNKGNAISILQGARIDGNKHIIGTTAALVPHKDPLTMVEAIGALSKMRNDFVFLHFGDGELMSAIKYRIAELGLENAYELMGFHKDVEDVFSVLEVFVMSSVEEGLGSSVLDAFAYKVPVVSTDAGGLKGLLNAGRGVMCAKKDALAIANAINDLLNNEANSSIVDNAFSYVQQYHSLEYITAQYLKIL
jgi:glycosyltransferase involved in cell wall biosynthesis